MVNVGVLVFVISKKRPLLVFIITKTKTPTKPIHKIYMAVNYDHSKTIIRNKTKHYHPCADDLLLPKICRKKRMKAITCV